MLVDRAYAADARRVDDVGDRAAVEHRVERTRDGPLVDDVAGDHVRSASDIESDHLRASRLEAAPDRGADGAARAGDRAGRAYQQSGHELARLCSEFVIA